MKQFKQAITILFLSFLISSCAVIGINSSRKTPDKPGHYPEFTEEDSLRGQLTRFRSAYDVTYYDLNIDVDIENKYLKGAVTLLFTVVDELDTLQIDLYENLKISRIVHNGHELSFRRKYKAVFIDLDEVLHKGEKHSLTVFYEGKPVTRSKTAVERWFRLEKRQRQESMDWGSLRGCRGKSLVAGKRSHFG